jgi:lipid II:glycine glycyltransferase (peptidoglycan interpeptide bridge formation enzyme)
MAVELSPKVTKQIIPSSVLQQTSFWAMVKENQGCETRAFDLKIDNIPVFDENSEQNCILDDLLIIIRGLGTNASMAYIPYGPTIEPQYDFRGYCLEELSESLRPYLPDHCLFIRYDLSWQTPWIKDGSRYTNNGAWMGNPEPHIREMRMNFGTQNWKLRKAPTDILPSSTVFLDVKKDENQLLGQMKPKTRYNIRLSHRRGVRIVPVSVEELPVWYYLYKETAMRNGIRLHDYSYFESICKTAAKNPYAQADVHLLMAELGEKPVAGMFLAIAGGRATYLYGASASENRNSMATYALQWSAIAKAKEHNCKEYDMFGISQTPDPAHPMYGLHRFKTGFGGDNYHRQGCWDYPLIEEQYEVCRSIELHSSGYHV